MRDKFSVITAETIARISKMSWKNAIAELASMLLSRSVDRPIPMRSNKVMEYTLNIMLNL